MHRRLRFVERFQASGIVKIFPMRYSLRNGLERNAVSTSNLLPDRVMGRLLFVDVPSPTSDATRSAADGRGERAFGFSLVFSGIRCILQYAILPFVLPVLGVTMDAAAPISLAINLVAIVLIIYSLRRFWKIGYRHRWKYLPVALTALTLLVAFIALDLHVITTR